MQNEQINPGDLVQIIKPLPCCGRIPSNYGEEFIVSKLEVFTGQYKCYTCGHVEINPVGVWGFGDKAKIIDTLKKIKPLPEEEKATKKEPVYIYAKR